MGVVNNKIGGKIMPAETHTSLSGAHLARRSRTWLCRTGNRIDSQNIYETVPLII
ncbi:MAG: hypothetical protein KAJ16_06430 [Calditrichia bacterium]|nr:hypothetical protein [Calditrichia bacterium]